MKPDGVIVERRVACESAPEQLWDLLTDTNRLNHAQGLAPFRIEPVDAGRERNRVTTRFGPLEIEFVEEPMEWVRPRYFNNPRRMTRGPIAWTESHFELEPTAEGGCVVLVRGTIAPRWAFLRPLVRIGLAQQMNKLVPEIERMDRIARGKPSRPEIPPTASLDAAALSRAMAVARQEAPDAADVLSQLEELVSHGTDVELSRIRPFEVADEWGLDRRRVLETLLAASVAGVLDLRWELVCPSCNTVAEEVPALADIEEHSRCSLCDLTFGVALDTGVEVTFQPNPAVRRVPPLQFCTGGPGRTPHVLVQYNVTTGQRLEIPVPAQPGRYRLFARGGATASLTVAEGEPASAEVMLAADQMKPAQLSLGPGAVVSLTQTAGDDRHVKLERVDWASRAATGYYVNTLPLFRRLFSHEALRPGLALRVSRAALLFTDLSGSTALYTSEGDAIAFRLVQDHFELLGAAIARHEGAIVKTIGDAIMGSFLDEAHAVQAAIEMQRIFAGFQKEAPRNEAVGLKVGVYAGPCYAVRANGILDYFGQSVNLAARLEGQARAGQIVMTEDLFERSEAAGWLDGARVVERFAATLKGIDESIPAVRLAV